MNLQRGGYQYSNQNIHLTCVNIDEPKLINWFYEQPPTKASLPTSP